MLMKAMLSMVLALAAMALLTSPVLASEVTADKVSYLQLDKGSTGAGANARSSAAVAGEDQQLDQRKSDFVRFARAKLEEMNRNHHLSRSRMQIDKTSDGSYRAVYHQIDDTSMACEVNRSQSKSIPYVAVLSYKEQIYAASCPTPEACRQGQFASVGIIPNRHIFSYSNGSWK
jgi:hypothetical protein